jgi:PhzF family phenazine biosynthesis protein
MTSVLRYAAFTSTPDGGNPAGIVLDASSLGDAEMQKTAADVGFAETAFLTDPAIAGDTRHARVRYFSPIAEVPFCGHATVATAIALARRDGVGTTVFETPVGPISIVTTGVGDDITAAFTSVEPKLGGLSDEVLLTLLGQLDVTRDDLDPRFPPMLSFAGNWHPVLVFADRGVFDGFEFDPAAMRALMNAQGWTGTVITMFALDGGSGADESGADESGADESGADENGAHENGAHENAVDRFEARNLFPVGTMSEDPATGSAAASVGGYLRALGIAPDRIVIHQGAHVGRPSLLTVDIPPTGGIIVSGTAVEIV